MKLRPDFYTRKSREEGYPARSIFKLKEIQERHKPLRPGSRVLDLGASPGSWSLYLLDLNAGAGRVVGVDLNPPDRKLLSRRGYTFLQGDFSLPEVAARIEEEGPFDSVVSDAAPSTTGTRSLDTARSAQIVRTVLAICRRCLVPGGSCVLKIFQGGEEREILAEMRGMFAEFRALKPRASRSESMETYFLGLGFRTPSPP
jgi:23S rRNA (uridine2552-2'-O)-methyltransferase